MWLFLQALQKKLLTYQSKIKLFLKFHAIKRSVEKIFKVNVIKINTINLKGKTKIVRGKKAKKADFKKAIITLKKGQSIDLSTGI